MQNGKQVYQYDFHNNLLYRMQYHLFEYFPSFSCYTIYFTHLYKRVKRQQNKKNRRREENIFDIV